MALFLKQTDQRSELQSRIDQELREKLQIRQGADTEQPPSALAEDSAPTRGAGFVIIAIVLLALLVGGIALALNMS